MSFSCGPHGWRHLLKGCPSCESMFQKTVADTGQWSPRQPAATCRLVDHVDGNGRHSGPCQDHCTCAVARFLKAVQPLVTYKPGDHVIGKVYDLTASNVCAMLEQIDLLTRTCQDLTASYEAACKKIEQLEVALKHEKKRRALLIKAVNFGSKRDSGRGD